MSKTERPSVAFSRSLVSAWRVAGSRCVVGSSRISSAGSARNARASARRCRSPPETAAPRAPTGASHPWGREAIHGRSRARAAYDAPGCGETCCEDLPGISIPFLVKTAKAVLDQAGIRRFHLVGHSMGGLTALLLAHQEPDRVLSFTDIEGNLAPEDCFLSRQILTHPCDDDVGFLEGFAERARRSPSPSSALFAASLRHKVRPGAVRGIFASMVDLSDHGDLMPKFLSLPCPRMFMYGAENSALSYLPKLAAGGVELAEIPQSGHWPMYANPVAMWERIAAIIRQAQACRSRSASESSAQG